MFRIVIGEFTYSKIDNFTNSFSGNFIKMYTDTGIHSEDIIQKSYIQLGDRLRELIISEIRKIFTQEKIYGISTTDKNEQFTTISINHYRLFVYFTEDRKEKLRIIENIEIFKK